MKKIFKKNIGNKKGFTLSELVIVLAILGVLFTISGKTYSGERKRVQYNNAIMDVLTVVKEARNYSVTSRMAYDANRVDNINTTINESLPENHRFIPKEGYGVYIEKIEHNESGTMVYDGAEVKMFVNVEDSSTPDNTNKYNNPDDLIEQEYDLGKKYITLDGIYSGYDKTTSPITFNGEVSDNKASIIFRPPLADSYISNNSGSKIVTLYIVFSNPNAPAEANKKIIKINTTSGFAELLSESDL